MNNAANPKGNAARYKQADTRIIPHPTLETQHACQRRWKRLCAAWRSPADHELLVRHRSRLREVLR